MNENEEKTNMTPETEAAAPEAAPEAAAEEAAADAAEQPDFVAAARQQLESGEFDGEAFLAAYQEQADGREAAEGKLLRLQADFDNFRRRSNRDIADAIFSASSSLMNSLLPVLDNFERAAAAMADGPDKEGVLLIARQFADVLTNNGLKEIEALGADFDPNLHHAVLQAEAGPENKGKVTMVLQKGYLLNDRLLRAAMVQVGL